MRHSVTIQTVALFMALTLPWAEIASSKDWLQFRGSQGTGVIESAQIPVTWSETQNILWKTPIDGRGWSSPIVVGNQVIITTVVRSEGTPEAAKPGLYFGGDRNQPDQVVHSWRAISLDRSTGKVRWNKELHQGVPSRPRHIKNSYASETPVSDGSRIYVLFGDVGLYCLDMEGKQIWSRELPACKTRNDWGTAASPVVHDGRLFIVSDSEDASYLLAVDASTGNDLWKVERDEKSNWATPYIWENELRTEIITPGSGKTRAYDLEGNQLYEFSGCSSITIAKPYAANGLLIVSSGYVGDQDRPIFAIKPGASGDITLRNGETSNEFIAWCQPQGAPYNPSTITYEGQLYVLHDRGLFSAYDALTGEVVYEKQRIPNGRSFTASPWACDGRIYCLNEFGETTVIQAGREFTVLQRNQLSSEELCMATPAAIGDQLVLRTGDAVYMIGDK